MCGIAGILDLNGRSEIDTGILNAMNEAQHHRGPDDGGIHVEPGLGLAHRRLAIIDLTSAGHQPMLDPEGDIVVVYNGEIYNFMEIRQELEAGGAKFRTHTDTEVILHGWKKWGKDCVQHFRGMFAFALWDKRSRELFVVRDRLGIKPLFYAITPDQKFIFGSELKVLYQYPGLQKEIEPECIEDYLAYGYVPEPRTILKNVFKLEPGTALSIKEGQFQPALKTYWSIPFETNHSLAYEDASAELLHRMREAVKIRMIADVPLGAFLSGGVDSSSVVALMSGLQDSPVNTCSIAFDDKKFNESEFAQQVADKYRTNHFQKVVDTDDFSLVGKLASLYDEPYADSSALPTYRVCELARQQVTVALSGDGADESMSGYRRHVWHMNEEQVRSRIPYAIRKNLFGFLGRAYPKLDWMPRVFRAKSTFQALGRNSVEAYFHTIAHSKDDFRAQLYSSNFKRQLNGYNAVEVFKRHAKDCPSDHPLNLIEYLDLKTYLVGDILTKVDRASMAHSLEVRVPLLDHKLIEFISSLPPEFKIKGQTGKYILKNTMEPHLPSDILYRPKMGFAVPLAGWFRGVLREHVDRHLLHGRLADTGYFKQERIQQLVNEHQSGRRDHSTPIWSLLMLEQYIEQVLG